MIDLQQPISQIQQLKELQIFQETEPTKENFEADLLLYFCEFLIFKKNLNLLEISKEFQKQFQNKYKYIFVNLKKSPKQFFMDQTDSCFQKVIIKKETDCLEEFESTIYFWLPKDFVLKLYSNEEFIFLKQCVQLQKKRLTLFTKLKTLISKTRKILLNSKDNIHSIQKKLNDYKNLKKGLQKYKDKVDYWFEKLTGKHEIKYRKKQIYIPQKITKNFIKKLQLTFDVYYFHKKENKTQHIFKSIGCYNFKFENLIDKQQNIKQFFQNKNDKKQFDLSKQDIIEYFNEQKCINERQSLYRFVRIESQDFQFKEHSGMIQQKENQFYNPFQQNIQLVDYLNYNYNTEDELESLQGESLKSSYISNHNSNYQIDDSFIILENQKKKKKNNQEKLLIINFKESKDKEIIELQQRLTAFKISPYEFPIPNFEKPKIKKQNTKEIKFDKNLIIKLIGLESKKQIEDFNLSDQVNKQVQQFINEHGTKIYFPKTSIFKQYFKLDYYMKIFKCNWRDKIKFVHIKDYIQQQELKPSIIVLFMGSEKQYLMEKKIDKFFHEFFKLKTDQLRQQIKDCLVKRYYYNQQILQQYNITDQEIIQQIVKVIQQQLILKNLIRIINQKMKEQQTDWTFLFTMVGIEFILILMVFIIERYMKNKSKVKEEEKLEQILIQPPENSLAPTNKKFKNRITN